jgi:acetyl-CoA carboxylase alpha subunit
MRDYRIRTISPKEMKRRFQKEDEHVHSVTMGKTIYVTPKTNKETLQHEIAHVKLGHTPARLTIYQYIKRELRAWMLACKSSGRPFQMNYLTEVSNDARIMFGTSKVEADRATLKAKRELKIRL